MFNLTETERSLIAMALRDKSRADLELAQLDTRLADTFKHQAQMAIRLADLIENAETVAVEPYQPVDGEFEPLRHGPNRCQ